jgi:hypothetical protein
LTGAVSVVSSAHAATPAWQIVPSPGADARLAAVSFTAPTNGWAVGVTAGLDTLIEKWDGASWRVVPSPAVDFSDESLTAVTATSATDAWAVGWQDPYGTTRVHGLFVRWNGQQWSVVQGPTGIFRGIHARTASDIWAVGNDNYAHFNGQTWSRLPSPETGTHPAAVVTLAPNNAWAVGGREDPRPGYRRDQPYLAHWNGTAWSSVVVPGQLGRGSLASVSAVSPSDVWAVGSMDNAPIAIHYNGTSWQRVAIPAQSERSELSGVTALAPNDVWAVGNRNGVLPNGYAVLRTFTEHWNGVSWSIVSSPNDSDQDNFLSAATASQGTVWAVGGDGGTLIERHVT